MKRILAALLFACIASIASAQSEQTAPFIAQPGGTRHGDVTASATTITLATPALPGPLMQLALQTFDTSGGTCTTPVYFRHSGTATTTTDMPVRPSVVFLVSVPASTTTLSVISTATGCTLYVTVGAGK